ncbi:hypothetical protein [Actibacterium sp. D379-3]
MPDPIKHMEIEDVLSSIRRLVADETADRVVPTALRAEGRVAASAGRLVLTPALRVEQPDATPAPAEVPQEAEAEAPRAPAGAPVGEDTDLAPEQTSEAAPHPVDSWEEVSLEDRIAELEAAVAGCEEEWEPDGSELGPHRTFSLDDLISSRAEPAEPAVMPEEVEAEAAGPTVEAATVPDTESDKTGDEANMFGGDPDVLDEDMLRQLVNDIVREELQGDLGERITRNVRKLVRREINRAMASRDFE